MRVTIRLWGSIGYTVSVLYALLSAFYSEFSHGFSAAELLAKNPRERKVHIAYADPKPVGRGTAFCGAAVGLEDGLLL